MGANTIKFADLAKVRDIEFVKYFNEGIASLRELLGITDMIDYKTGTLLKAYKTTGTLENGSVAEAENIPVSEYKREVADVAEFDFSKWAKETSYEAVKKRGYPEAVRETDDKFILDIQKVIRSQILSFIASGTGRAGGEGLQDTLANAWGNLSVAFNDYTPGTPVYLVNTMDVSRYLGRQSISTQTSFGMGYLEDFLGLGRVITSPLIPEGIVYCTASENMKLYKADPTAEGFDFYTDETGLIGIHHDTEYTNLVLKTTAVSALTLFPEFIDRIIVGNIMNPSLSITVEPENGATTMFSTVTVSDLQTNLSVGLDDNDGHDIITGTLKYVDSGTLAQTWGPGYFMALKFTGLTSGAKAYVGMLPSVSSGAKPLDADITAYSRLQTRTSRSSMYW